MFEIKENRLLVSDIANYLNNEYIGLDFDIVEFGPFSETIKENTFSFIEDINLSLDIIDKNVLIICPIGYSTSNSNISIINAENPKLSFYNVVNEFFIQDDNHQISENATIKNMDNLGVNISIGDNSYIGKNVVIGNNSYIGNNVTIKGNVSVGRDCYIKDGAIIGSEGFDFIESENGLVHVPQVGKIEIGNNVWVGSNSVIERASLDKTLIENNVKIDDLVQIGNSCKIKSNTKLAAGVVVGENSVVGEKSFIGMNVSIKEDIIIEDEVIVGSGASVVTNLEKSSTYVGVPAKKIQKREV